MSTNRKEILELLASGKVTAAQAAEMLNQPADAPVETPTTPATPPATPATPTPPSAMPAAPAPAWFRVRVSNMETGQNKISINIPVKMLKLGLKIGGRFAPELAGLDWNELNSLVQGLETGLLVEVQDEEKQEHVRVYLE